MDNKEFQHTLSEAGERLKKLRDEQDERATEMGEAIKARMGEHVYRAFVASWSMFVTFFGVNIICTKMLPDPIAEVVFNKLRDAACEASAVMVSLAFHDRIGDDTSKQSTELALQIGAVMDEELAYFKRQESIAKELAEKVGGHIRKMSKDDEG